MKNRNVRIRILAVLLPVLALLLLRLATLYAHADQTALDAMQGGGGVTVEEIPEGWLFDGPSDDTAVVFYTGFRVEEPAYAPLLLLIAQESADVFAVKMPFYTASLGVNQADKVRDAYSYEHWYLLGHSLGGNVAADYTASTEHPPDGLMMLASVLRYGGNLHTRTLALCGSADGILDLSRFEAMRAFLPAGSAVHCIEGGNHGQFGSYGAQIGDGPASITPEAQWREAADWIHWFIRDGDAASAPDTT